MTPGGLRQLAGLALFGLALFVNGCTPFKTYRFAGTFLSTGYGVTLVGNYDEARLQSLQEGIEETLAQAEHTLLPQRPDAELTRLEQAPSGEFVLLSEPMAELLRDTLSAERLTGVALDATAPCPAPPAGGSEGGAVSAAEPGQNDYHGVQLLGTALIKYRPARLGLDALAAGYAVDRVADYLEAHDIDDYLIEVGGKLRSHGRNGKGAPWRVVMPGAKASADASLGTVTLDQAAPALATEHGAMPGGASSSAGTADADNDPAYRVTVLAARCRQAEALAKTLGALGPERGLELAERENIAAYYVVQTHGTRIYYSSAFAPYLSERGE